MDYDRGAAQNDNILLKGYPLHGLQKVVKFIKLQTNELSGKLCHQKFQEKQLKQNNSEKHK